jgi:hypothetical protein
MRYQFLFILIISTLLISCGGNPSTTTNTNSTAGNNAPVKANSNSPVSTTKTPEPPKTNEGATLAPIVQAYFEALKRKDEAAAKKLLSAAALKYYEEEAKLEKKTWFAYVLEDSHPVEEKREVRNETISGDRGVVEIKGGNLGVFTKVVFVKEGGEWKFASEADKISENNIPKTSAPSGTPK